MTTFINYMMLSITTFYSIITFASIMQINKELVSIHFSDGDTFKILQGVHKGSRVRIQGINALESYGPIHSWINTDADYLMTIAKEATSFAQKGSWSCSLEMNKDQYGRMLAKCDDFAISILEAGLAHAYSINNKPAYEEYLSAQNKAQRLKYGMWKYGKPEYIITSLHSFDSDAKKVYNRLINTQNGHSRKWFHDHKYQKCEQVCQNKSCMLYVPYEQRYGHNQAECLVK